MKHINKKNNMHKHHNFGLKEWQNYNNSLIGVDSYHDSKLILSICHHIITPSDIFSSLRYMGHLLFSELDKLLDKS